MPAATANAYYDGLTVVFLGPINPTQLTRTWLTAGSKPWRENSALAYWRSSLQCTGHKICTRLGGGNKKSPWHFHKEIINENAVDGDWKSIL